jgi:hypothetical protein
MVTNQKWACAAFKTGSISAFLLNQARNLCISLPSRFAAQRLGWICFFPIGPEMTCIGPVLSSRHPPISILCIPLRPARKQRSVPAKQPFARKRFVVVPSGVEHHFDNAIDIATGRPEGDYVDP